VALLPWVALTLAYHYGMRMLDGLAGSIAGSIDRRRPSVAVGGWIEDRARAVVFAAHRPLRLRDWGARLTAAIDDGVVPVADVWHANDLETLPLALGLRDRLGGRVVFDSHELFVEAAGRARLGPLRRRMLRTAERRWARRSDGTVTVNAAVAAELTRRDGVHPIVVRNCPPMWTPGASFVSPLRGMIAERGLDPGRPIVIAHGGFQAHRGFEELLAAAETIEDLNVVFLGYGGLGATYEEIASGDRWRGRLAVLPAVAPDDLLALLAGADLAACLIQPTTLNHRLSTPNKLFESIAAGVPLLAADLPAIATIVRQWEVGWLVDPTDLGAIREALSGLIGQPALRAEMAGRARVAAETELNWAHEFAGLAALYDELSPRRPPIEPARGGA
jgi:glycosyltransferase involved in cell wall biosynthesis